MHKGCTDVYLLKDFCDCMAQVGLLEDNIRIAKLCSTMLQYAGHQVVIFEHSRACLDALLPSQQAALHRGPSPIDVLILDLHLPDIPGIDVLSLLRAHPRTSSLPLIFCTAATPGEISRALSMAPEACFIEKPFTYQELVSAITRALHPIKVSS